LFYQKHKILESEDREFRLALTAAVGQVIKKGLNLLGIQAPEKM
jgi:arginyl-tRNA synthetase